jgi:hypothetical protein
MSSFEEFKRNLLSTQERLHNLLKIFNQNKSFSETDRLSTFEENLEEDFPKIIKADPFELKSFICMQCQKVFSDKRKLKSHEKVHNRKKELVKNVKSKQISTGDATNRICPDCGKVLKGNNHLNFHIKTKHLKLTKYSCDLCLFKSYGKYEIRSHIMIHHLPLEMRKEFKCDECESVLTTLSSLKIHKQHKHSNQKPHTCFCGKSYALKETLKSHIKNVHNLERRYKCTVCLKGFNSQPRLNDHFLNSHTEEKQKIPCDKCNKVFNSLRNLHTHKIYHEPKTLKCSFENCDKTFYIKKNLREHENSAHLGIIYKCEHEHCQRTFQSTSGLRRHLKSHNKLK